MEPCTTHARKQSDLVTRPRKGGKTMLAIQFLVICTFIFGALTVGMAVWEKFGSTQPGERFMAAIDHILGGDSK